MIPVQMGLSDNGLYLYVTNMGSNSLYTIDLSRFEVVNKIRTGSMARGISMDEGRIFVSNSEDNNVSIIDTKKWCILGNIEVGNEPTSMLYLNKSNS
jgi:YVTN family beta-propeller protein